MFVIYDLIFIIGFLFYLPILLVRRKIGRHFLNRLGFFLKKQTNPTIWIHAVSVGEVNCLKELCPQLKNYVKDINLVVSTVTPAGNKLARKLTGVDYVFYLPLDLSFIVSKFIRLLRPKLVIIVETEFWPNLIYGLNKNKIPIVIANGRISDRSFGRYKFFKFFFKNIINKINLFSMQSPTDAKRIISLGASPSLVKTCGNMKFDTKHQAANTERQLNDNELLLVAASTHRGEEIKILTVYKNLINKFNNLRLLIAPRHIERSGELETLIASKFGMPVKKIQSLQQISGSGVFILDVIGVLSSVYSIADIVFVGGSLVKKGGQNILEPAFFAKPIIIGQHYFNFRDIVENFKQNNAIVMVEDGCKLELEIEKLIIDKDKRIRLGVAARNVLLDNQGATSRNLELIKGFVN